MNRSLPATSHVGWVLALAGMVCGMLGLGAGFLLSPLQHYYYPTVGLAIFIFSIAVFECVFAIVQQQPGIRRWPVFGRGLVDGLISGYFFLHPDVDPLGWLIVAGAWLLVRGVLAIGGFLRSYGSDSV